MGNHDRHYMHDLKGVFEKYANVCDWFDGLGFSYARTRYGIYKRSFGEFERLSQSSDRPNDLIAFKHSFDNAYVEANEIVRVHDSLRQIDSQEFDDQIKKVLSGSEFRGDTDQSRNFLFELAVACRFIRAGYAVILTGISDVVADLGATDGRLYVECKRIKSERKIATNVKKANRQIAKRVSTNSNGKSSGLVAVNITDLLPDTLNLYPDSPQAATALHRTVSKQVVGSHIEAFADGINEVSLGVMCESSTMAYLSERSSLQGLVYSRHSEFLPYRESPMFERLAPQLCNQDIT